MRNVLITGYTGFVGAELLKLLSGVVPNIVLLGRRQVNDLVFHKADFESSFDAKDALRGVDVVFHCAARAHIMNDQEPDPLSHYRRVNVEATLALARQAAALGIKRFVFLSSIKVNGEITYENKPFTEAAGPIPGDPYGLSKYEAELQLTELSEITGMEIVIIRPPLVYGPQVKGNFVTMVKLATGNFPIPLRLATRNKRSLLALENLVSFIILCGDYNKTPQAANEIFVISDNEDVSTAELIVKVANAYGKKVRLLPIPIWFLQICATLIGKKDMVARVLGSLQVDSSKARNLLGWKSVITMGEQLEKMARVD
jgi:nucleoside-diphosphate-sugar epimerase